METPRLPSAAHTHQASRPPRDTDCPQGKERPPGTRDGTTLSSAVRPAPRPRWRRDYRAPSQGPGAQPGSRTAPSPQAAVATARAAARPAQPQAAESETSCGRARAGHFLCLTAAPGSPARHAAAASVRSSVRSGLGAAGPSTLSSGGGVRGSALHAPREQSSRAEPWAERGAEGQLGAGAVCTPGVLPRTAPGKQTLSVRSV